MIGVQCHWWFVEDTLEHPRVHFKYFYSWRFFGKLTFKSYFSLWSSFQVKFESSLMGWEVKNLLSCQSKHGLVGSSAKTRNFLSRESQEWKTCTFLGSKHKSAIWDETSPYLHIKSSLYVWRRAHGSQIFKRNSIISIRSRFIEFLKFLLLWLQGAGQVGGGYLGSSEWSEWV